MGGLAAAAPQEPDHPAKGLGHAPQKLIPDREGGQVFAAHPELVDPPDRNLETTAHRGRGELREGRLRGVLDHPHPVRARRR